MALWTKHGFLWFVLSLVLCLVLCQAPLVMAADAAADSSETHGDSWLDRTLKRFFGGSKQYGDTRAGGATQLTDRYLQYAGKTIEVVLIHPVLTFEDEWDATKGTSTRLLNDLATPLQSYTKDSTIREYILFDAGDTVDPFALADSERMIRDLEYINDVRILLVPLTGEPDKVVVVVETRDRWPIGATGRVKDVDWYEASLYSTNVGGLGIRFDNKILYRAGYEPELGYRGDLAKQNIKGSFIGAKVEYEDSWRALRKFGGLERQLIHPNIQWVGGAEFESMDDRNYGDEPRKFEDIDAWVGDVIRVDERPGDQSVARGMLVPAVRYVRRTYLERPEVTADSNTSFHNSKNILGGLTWRKVKDYRTSFLFDMGEAENIESGLVLKANLGYQDGEFHGRSMAGLNTGYQSVRNRGDVVFLDFDIGGFFRNQRMEDGVLRLGGGYITPLWGESRYRTRLYSRVEYVYGINRTQSGGLMLGERTGITDMEDNQVYGDQRLVLKLESRLFTPWTLWGFRFMVFGFLDTGAVAGEDDPLLEAKFYTSLGLGVRINNPDLVFPTFELRLASLQSIAGDGTVFGVVLGNPNVRRTSLPGVKPGGLKYD